ncbi:MAG: hypothetical protein LBD79_09815 [Treponema sp.]|nr:hypothetical protein [Treponema sp.]
MPRCAAEFEGQRYGIFHPLNHKVVNVQVEASLEGCGLYGLFTSAANIAYALNILMALDSADEHEPLVENTVSGVASGALCFCGCDFATIHEHPPRRRRVEKQAGLG